MRVLEWTACSAALLVMLMLSSVSSLTVMSVDFGTEFMKIAVVAPGVPMEIALNKESKRKTPVAIAFRDGERTFGDDAITAGMRSPSSVFLNLLHLLGKSTEHPIVQSFKETHPQYTIETHPVRGTVVLKISETESQTVEELIAQLLSHARDQASAHTGQQVKDLVITVPPFFNQAERRALLDAAAIANLKVLSLISSNAAVALNYGMFRRKEINGTAQHLLFYDMGSSQTTATVVAYQTVKTKEKGYAETNPQLSILGVGFDRTLGGYKMQLRLRDYLAQKFNDMKKTTTNVFDNPRAMSKINKEAARLKRVLSANSEHVSQIENVMEDIDLRVMVKRPEFEDLITDLVARASDPINEALVAAGIDISVLDQLVLVGGATRLPAIQEHLQKLWGKELSRNINADEAAALGAVYRAADIGQGFKVKTFHVKESNLYPIEVEFDRQVEQEDGSIVERVVKRSLFAIGNVFPQKKLMTFNKHTSDFGFRINYGDMTSHLSAAKIREQFGSISSNISEASVTGVDEAYNKQIADDSVEFKGIKAHFSLDPSGILHLGDIEMVVERNVTVDASEAEDKESTISKIGSTLSKLFGGDEDDDSNTTDGGKEAKPDAAADAAKEKINKTDTNGAGNGKSSKLVTEKTTLNNTQVLLDLAQFTEELLGESTTKLATINTAEAERELCATRRNDLETLILDIKDKMTEEEYIAASLPDVQALLTKLCNTFEEWLYEDGFDASAATYNEKISELEKDFKPIASRVEQHRERPQAIKALNNMMNMSSDFLQRAHSAPEGSQWFTSGELQHLDELIVSTQSWLEKAEDAQAELKASVDPSLTLMSIADKIQDIDREVKYLVNKAKMVRAKAEREAAELKIKLEKEAKEAERKKKKEDAAAAAAAAAEAAEGEGEAPGAEKLKTDSEAEAAAGGDEGDVRKEPPMPEEEPSLGDTRQPPPPLNVVNPDGVEEQEEETHTEL